MDFFSITIAMCVFAFFILLWISFFYFRNPDLYKKNKLLLMSSFFMFLSFLSFHFEFKYSSVESNYSFIFSFFSFACLMYAIFTITLLIGDLYDENFQYKKLHLLSYSIFSGFVYSLNTIYGTYLTGFIVLLVLMIVPGIILSKGLLLSKQNLYRTPFLYQIGLLGLFYVLKMTNLFSNPTISPANPNSIDSIYTLFTLITLMMFYVTYLLEYNHKLNLKLLSKSNVLSKTLTEVKLESEKDTLTRIPNRGKLNEMLEACMNTYNEYGIDFTIAMIDVNNFKQINDLHGHVYGDEALINISDNIRNSIRSQDVVGRWGGDEFLLIFPSTDSTFVEKVGKKILEGFKDHEVSLSIGFATASECDDIKSMIHEADSKMYEHKYDFRDNATKNYNT